MHLFLWKKHIVHQKVNILEQYHRISSFFSKHQLTKQSHHLVSVMDFVNHFRCKIINEQNKLCLPSSLPLNPQTSSPLSLISLPQSVFICLSLKVSSHLSFTQSFNLNPKETWLETKKPSSSNGGQTKDHCSHPRILPVFPPSS